MSFTILQDSQLRTHTFTHNNTGTDTYAYFHYDVDS